MMCAKYHSNETIGAEQVRRLIKNLQLLAKEAGHERPLMIGIDQENGLLRYTYIAGRVRMIFTGLVSAFSSPTAGTQLCVI
jgi:beta-N-acetylhexosaminidase